MLKLIIVELFKNYLRDMKKCIDGNNGQNKYHLKYLIEES